MSGEEGIVTAGLEVVFRHAWMQKHPTPTQRSGDFHWHPADVPAGLRGELTDLVTRSRGQRLSLWIVGEDYVVWARAFSAVAPADQRRYTGMAATIAVPAPGSQWKPALAEILARMPLVPAAPYTAEPPAPLPYIADGSELDRTMTGPRPVDPERLAELFDPNSTDLARSLYIGGPAHCLDPHDDRLPGMLARLLSWLPEAERTHPRIGALVEQAVSDEISANADRGMVNLAHYLTRAWFCPEPIRRRLPGFPVYAWQIVLDLATSLGRSLPDLLAGLGAVASAWDTAEDLHRYLLERRVLTRQQVAECDRRAPRPLFLETVPDAGWLWNRIMHYWGRSFLPVDDSQLSRLAALLAQRIAVDHLFHLDAPDRVSLPRRYLRRLKFESLLPSEHIATMLRALEHYMPSLLRHPEVPFG